MFGCASVSDKNSPLSNQARLIEEVIKNNPQMSETDKAILKASVKDLRYADKVIVHQDKEKDKIENKLISQAKEAGAGKLTYVFLGILALGIIMFGIYKIKPKFL